MKILKYEKDGYARRITIFGVKLSWKSKNAKVLNSNTLHFDVFDNYGFARSVKEGACVNLEGEPIPWYTYPSIEYLSQFDYSDKNVFEFGCGNSTLWWANRAKNVAAVENNEEWYKSRLEFDVSNVSLYLEVEPEKYARKIIEVDNDNSKKFDVIVIDGMWRDKCALCTLEKISPDGMVIFDNSNWIEDNPELKKASEILKKLNFIQIDFYGYGPLNEYTWTTSVYLSRNFNFKTKNELQPIMGINNIRGC